MTVLLKCEHCKALFAIVLEDTDVRHMRCPYCAYESVVVVQDADRALDDP